MVTAFELAPFRGYLLFALSKNLQINMGEYVNCLFKKGTNCRREITFIKLRTKHSSNAVCLVQNLMNGKMWVASGFQ